MSMSSVQARPNREVLSIPERVVDPVASYVAMGLALAFFAYHLLAPTGFFTERFGFIEMVCLFGPMILSLAAPIVRALTGRRNPGRPLEVITNVFMALGALWLLIIFPFDFTHLADPLPAQFQFILAWVTNEIGRFVLLLQVIVGSLVALFTLLKFFSVLMSRSASSSSSPTS